jgi:hypothetical protein
MPLTVSVTALVGTSLSAFLNVCNNVPNFDGVDKGEGDGK